jgi:cell division protein FtsQ
VQSVSPQGSAPLRGQPAALPFANLVLPRIFRRPARALSHLLGSDIPVPRFAGAALVLSLLGATGIYGAALGGHMPAIVQAVAAGTGFAVTGVNVTGNTETSEIDVLGAIGLNGYTSLIGFDAEAARERIAALPWVKSAAVRKVYPSTLEVAIEERKPFAIWQHGSDLTIIEKSGKPIVAYPGAGYSGLPLVVGEGAAERASDFIARIAAFPELARHAAGYMRVADRRWDLRLDNGVTILLPERDEAAALRELVALDREQGLLSRDVVAIDMRLTDRVAIRLSPDLAEARQAALKESIAKAAKGRRT